MAGYWKLAKLYEYYSKGAIMEKKTNNGLPSEIRYCVKCNLINQRTTGKK